MRYYSRFTAINAMKNRIAIAENGTVFVASDFADIADNKKVGTSLSRLADEAEKVIY